MLIVARVLLALSALMLVLSVGWFWLGDDRALLFGVYSCALSLLSLITALHD